MNVYNLAHRQHLGLIESAIDISTALDGLDEEFNAIPDGTEKAVWAKGDKGTVQRLLLDRRSICGSSIRAHGIKMLPCYQLALSLPVTPQDGEELHSDIEYMEVLLSSAKGLLGTTRDRVTWRIKTLEGFKVGASPSRTAELDAKINGLKFCIGSADTLVQELNGMISNAGYLIHASGYKAKLH